MLAEPTQAISVSLYYRFLNRAAKPKVVPESHRSNSKKEKITLGYAENFRRQFRQLYGDRKALFLSPLNECGVEVTAVDALKATILYQ